MPLGTCNFATEQADGLVDKQTPPPQDKHRMTNFPQQLNWWQRQHRIVLLQIKHLHDRFALLICVVLYVQKKRMCDVHQLTKTNFRLYPQIKNLDVVCKTNLDFICKQNNIRFCLQTHSYILHATKQKRLNCIFEIKY